MTITPIARDEASAEFYDATARGELLLRRCTECGRVSSPEATRCCACGHPRLQPVVAAGRGRVVSWSVPRSRDGEVLMISGLIELDEGCWMRARIVGAEPATLAAGTPVVVEFVRSGPGDHPSGSDRSGQEVTGEVIPVFRVGV